MTSPSSPPSIYLHVPFCVHRCAYCDFNTYAGQESLIPAYVDSLIREINFIKQQLANQSDVVPQDSSCFATGNMNVALQSRAETSITSVFFGGGTPSLLSPSHFENIFRALHANFRVPDNSENTIEANPGTTSPEFLRQIREAGINRISFGVQSANPEELRMLERVHSFFDVIQSVKWARQAGFRNLNLDLIYGLPEQTFASWKSTLQRVVDLHPEHISAYALTLEHGTPFGRWSQRGLLPLPDPDLAADMYEFTEEFLAAHGYVHYEISNWAKANSEFKIQNSELMCRHNLQYWRSLPYLGLGAGAHGYAGGYRYSNVLRIKTYIERFSNLQLPISNYQFPLTPAVVNQHRQTERDDMNEYMLNNLRLLIEGVSTADFKSRFGRELMEVYPKEIEELTQNGLLEKKTSEVSGSEVYRLTKRGRLLGNQAFIRFV